MRPSVSLTTLVAALLLPTRALAQEPSPVGLWESLTDQGTRNALIRVTEAGGVLTGKIEAVTRPAGATGPALCRACEGALKDAPIVGLAILQGLTRDDEREWDGGTILDPQSGSTYDVEMEISEDGRTMEVRGFAGISLLGRTVTWRRVE